jgi:cell division septation protein DedD
MKGMDSFRKNLHLSRHEAWMVFVLVVLLASLMFSVGLWVGLGFSGIHQDVAAHSGSVLRAPASTEDSVDQVPQAGAELKKAFYDSKQHALAEAMLDIKASDTPKSILDAKAHQQTHDEWNRKPAADAAAVREQKALQSLQEKEQKRLQAGPPAKVQDLFERSPSAVKDFEPIPGNYTVQVASFATFDEASATVVQLRTAGFGDAYTKEIRFKNGEVWHRVAMGSYPNPVFARRMGERVRNRGLAKDFIVRKVAD